LLKGGKGWREPQTFSSLAAASQVSRTTTPTGMRTEKRKWTS
jgi:hypothetical protein